MADDDHGAPFGHAEDDAREREQRRARILRDEAARRAPLYAVLALLLLAVSIYASMRFGEPIWGLFLAVAWFGGRAVWMRAKVKEYDAANASEPGGSEASP